MAGPGRGVTVRLDVDGGVVVGDDGSAGARLAVTCAAEDAVRRGCTLHVVRCWSITSAPRPDSWTVGYVPPLAEWEDAVLAEMRRCWEPLRAELPDVDLRLHAVHARAGETLVDASAGADLVVVGSRGHGQLREMVLGSVAEHVAHRAHCPVLVVRRRRRA